MKPITCSLLFAILPNVQEPPPSLPQNYQETFNNDFVQVIRVHYEPHEKLPAHDHSRMPTVYVYLSDSGPVRFTHLEKHPFTVIRPALKFGTFRVSPGRIEKHEVENLGSIRSDFLRVELKRIPLGLQNFYYRGNQPIDLSHTAASTVFSNPRLIIQRIVISPGSKASEALSCGSPSLLIAFSNIAIKIRSSGTFAPKTLRLGDLYWLGLSQSVSLSALGTGSAHALRLVFPDAK